MKRRVSVMTTAGEAVSLELIFTCCAAAGYTGREQESVAAHVEELRRLGVSAPYATPAIYWISPQRLTDAEEIVVVGSGTSMEVEFFCASTSDGRRCLTVASDHTDRDLEKVSVSKAKQICDKVLGESFWFVEELLPHWDALRLESEVYTDGTWQPCQSGTLAEILPLDELEKRVNEDLPLAGPAGFFSGTLPMIGGKALFSAKCRIALIDPVLKREITKEYSVQVLPDRT